MFGTILAFEVRYHLRRPSTWLFFGIFFLLAFFMMASDIMAGGNATRVFRNSPYVITQSMLILTALGQVITAALMGTVVLRDLEHHTQELLYTTPINKLEFFGGRFAGGVVAMVLVYLAIPLGMLVGSMMPWVDPVKLGPLDWGYYFSPFLNLILPIVLFISAIFFASGLLFRSNFAIYIIGFSMLLANFVATRLRRDLDNATLTALTDPFGLYTFELVTRYWTPVEKNTLTVALSGLVMLNRIFWTAVAVAALAIAFRLFDFRTVSRGRKRRKAVHPAAESVESRKVATTIPATSYQAGRATWWAQTRSVVRVSTRDIIRSTPFLVLLSLGFIDHFLGAWVQDEWYNTTLYPTTYYMLEVLSAGSNLYLLLLLTIYAGELVWRERDLRLDQITDATPIAEGQLLWGKLTGLLVALLLALFVMALPLVAVQLLRGYTHLEPGLYLRWLLLIDYPALATWAFFAFMVHTLVNHKYLGHLVVLSIFIGLGVISNLGFEHGLYSFGRPPAFIYSDMNGFGHFVPRITWFTLYWLAIGLVLLAVARAFQVRGVPQPPVARIRAARRRLRGAALLPLGAAVMVALACGSMIFYNTNRLNRYEPRTAREARLAGYERSYRELRSLAQPRVVGVQLIADLYPEARRFAVGGIYRLVNRSQRPLDTLYLSLNALANNPQLKVDSLQWSLPTTPILADTVNGVFLFRLTQSLAPGDSLRLAYGIHLAVAGFPNRKTNTDIVANGSFIDVTYLPILGYDVGGELTDPDARRKQGLPVRSRMPAFNDSLERQHTMLASDADWVSFEAVVSTTPDQIAVAPGYLQEEWTANGRHYFHYVSDTPIDKFFAIVSGRYQVQRDQWKDSLTGTRVALEIFYHPQHSYNIARMMAGMQRALSYYTRVFGPYQFRQVRILEFPRYAGFAQSFPNTIPFSEGIGFVTRVGSADDDIDMPFFVTAHEVAHQWWGHQILGPNVQGSALLMESLAEYSALKVMEHEYGAAAAQKFLRYELDMYLRGRAAETIREQPLTMMEGQPYIHYYKGSLAFYALQDLIGEERLNQALAEFLHQHQYPIAPDLPTSLDLVAALHRATPDSLQPFVSDLFETITLWDHQTEGVAATRREAGKYEVTLTVRARKLRADSLGSETEVPEDDWVDIGVFGAREPGNALGRPLYLQKHRITQTVTTIRVLVDELPLRAGIDPYNKLFDREPKDNVRAVAVH